MTAKQFIKKLATKDNGQIHMPTLELLARLDPQRLILVKTQFGMMIVAAQDAANYITIIEKEGSDSIREVALMANDPAHRGDYSLATPERLHATQTA